MGGPRVRQPHPSTPFAGGSTGGAVPTGGPRAAPSAVRQSPGGGGGGMPMAIKKGGEVKKHEKGGEVKHDDEKQDRNLFHKMMKEKHEKHKKYEKGGSVSRVHAPHSGKAC